MGATLTVGQQITGSLSHAQNKTVDLGIPDVIYRNAMKYGTTEYWSSKKDLIAEKGMIYVYTDHKTIEDGDKIVYLPGLKIGDGTSYVVDLPFVNETTDQKILSASTEEWNSQPSLIAKAGFIYIYTDWSRSDGTKSPNMKLGNGESYLVDLPFCFLETERVTLEEKEFWNNKVTAYAEGKTLVLSKTETRKD